MSADPIRNSEHAETVQHEPPRLTPTQRLHEVTMAALEPRGVQRVEGAKYRQAATKDNFGKWSCEEVSFVRGEDETADEYRQRRQAELDWIERDLAARNADQYVNELHESAVQAGLRRLRDPEGVEA